MPVTKGLPLPTQWGAGISQIMVWPFASLISCGTTRRACVDSTCAGSSFRQLHYDRGAGTVLAASGFEIWIGLTAVACSAALAVVACLQLDSTISGYNRSAGRLVGLVRPWEALPSRERAEEPAFAGLVTSCEDVFVAELGGWVLQMTTALEELRERQGRGEGNREVIRSTGWSRASLVACSIISCPCCRCCRLPR